MKTRMLGNTGLKVSRLGLGLAEIGNDLGANEEEQAGQVLNAALDAGINFLDTAACYGDSEVLVGRAVAHRRDEFILATKAGHATGGYAGPSWTAQTVTDSIERSLKRLKTNYLDIVQLHSCGLEVLEQGDVIRALLDAKQAGKTRYVGYSGDNEAARWAVESGHFDTLQTSYNLVDQRARIDLFPLAQARGLGIIAKRPIANAAWGDGNGAPSLYRQRAREMAELGPISGAPDAPILLALGFTLAHDAVDTAIVGTKNPLTYGSTSKWSSRRSRSRKRRSPSCSGVMTNWPMDGDNRSSKLHLQTKQPGAGMQMRSIHIDYACAQDLDAQALPDTYARLMPDAILRQSSARTNNGIQTLLT